MMGTSGVARAMWGVHGGDKGAGAWWCGGGCHACCIQFLVCMWWRIGGHVLGANFWCSCDGVLTVVC